MDDFTECVHNEIGLGSCDGSGQNQTVDEISISTKKLSISDSISDF